MTLDLAPQEVDIVFNALAQRPWHEVQNLMQKVHAQVQAQVQPQPQQPSPQEGT